MIRQVYAFVDSAGTIHTTREDAARAEFRIKLVEAFLSPKAPASLRPEDGIRIDALVDGMDKLAEVLNEAKREDTRPEAMPPRPTA